MSFRSAVAATPEIASHYRAGLQALPGARRTLIRISVGRRLDGSVNIDKALRHAKPNDPRWDYGVGIKPRADNGRAIWIEIHPASSSHVDPVLRKLAWLRDWLRNEATRLHRIKARYVWLATGTVALPRNSPKRKLIAEQGLDFRANSIDLDEFSN
jgi:hypothetical protein